MPPVTGGSVLGVEILARPTYREEEGDPANASIHNAPCSANQVRAGASPYEVMTHELQCQSRGRRICRV